MQILAEISDMSNPRWQPILPRHRDATGHLYMDALWPEQDREFAAVPRCAILFDAAEELEPCFGLDDGAAIATFDDPSP